MKLILTFICSAVLTVLSAQSVMTPELLWSLGRVSGESVSADGKNVIFGVTSYDISTGKSERNLFSVAEGGMPVQLTTTSGTEYNVMKMPSGKMGFLYNSQL